MNAKTQKTKTFYFVNFAGTPLVQTSAKTLRGAKRAAAANCCFIGQTIRVFAGPDEQSATLIAYRSGDPINMGARGEWVDASL